MNRYNNVGGRGTRLLSTILVGALLVLVVGCTAADRERSAVEATPQPSATNARPTSLSVAVTPLPSATPVDSPTATASPRPSATPTQTPLPPSATPSPTPDPLAQFYIETLRRRSYGGDGAISVGPVLAETEAYTRYAISYPSDGLIVTGYVNVPHGDGPFPVIVLNHGYYDPGRYRTGDGTLAAADFLANRGYLTIASDYRVYAGSDGGPNDFRVGYVIDVLNLLALVDSLPQADPERIGIWGHSMGGGININVMVIDERIDAVVLYGPMSGDMADNWRHIRDMWNSEEMEQLAAVYGSPADRPEAYHKMSAVAYLEYVNAPVQIHHGTADTQVPYDWSVRLRDELEAAGKDVTLFTYEQAPHSFGGATWALFMQRVLEFYDEHVK